MRAFDRERQTDGQNSHRKTASAFQKSGKNEKNLRKVDIGQIDQFAAAKVRKPPLC